MNGPAVLYDAAVDGNPWLGVYISVFFLVAAAVSYAFLRRSRFGREQPRNAMFIAAVWLIAPIAPLVEVPHEFSLRSAVREGRAQVVVGEVASVEEYTHHRGASTVCFMVGDVHMAIVPMQLRHDLHEGERVRVHYVGDAANAEVVRFEQWPYQGP